MCKYGANSVFGVCYRICQDYVKSSLKKQKTLVVIIFSMLCVYLLGVKCMILFCIADL